MCDSDKFGISIVKYPDSDCVPSSLFFDYQAYIQSKWNSGECMPTELFDDINHDTDYIQISTDSNCTDSINLYDYANEHLKTYKRFLCDKLPNKTYIDGDIKEICETAEASSDNIDSNSWSWNPQGTSDISFTYEEWKTYKKDLNNDSREKQLKYDKKLQYNSKKFEIYSLLIVIPILLFILKKY
jgi:hypothetical protein